MKYTYCRRIKIGSIVMLLSFALLGCNQRGNNYETVELLSSATKQTVSIVLEQNTDLEATGGQQEVQESVDQEIDTTATQADETCDELASEAIDNEDASNETTESETSTEETDVTQQSEIIEWNPDWQYAEFSAIYTGAAKMYYAENPNGYTVCVNAGHGTEGGSSVKTLCHPDGTAKVTGGSTQQGAIKATAVAYGTTMNDETPEYKATLKVALAVKEKLLASGYHVLMIREGNDVQLDNIARTVFANNMADCHVALHYDSTTNDKGAFYSSVPNVDSYRQMEPVASNWESHHRLGDAVIEGLRNNDVKIFSDGKLPIDLTQTSYSTVPSVVVEVGDRGSDRSVETMEKLANGIKEGIDTFFGL